MPEYLLHIQVKPEAEQLAVAALAEIERLSTMDRGCLGFVWLQHKADPCRFTLFERWDTQENLDEHLNKITPRWHEFEPHLAAEPLSEPVRLVSALVPGPVRHPSAGMTTRNGEDSWKSSPSRSSPRNGSTT